MDATKTLTDPQAELENPTELYAVKVCAVLPANVVRATCNHPKLKVTGL